MSEDTPDPATLELWSRHYRPPKDALKDFVRGGGFSGTAIDPMWLVRCATEEWGPIGDRWGITVCSEEFRTFDPQHVLHVSTCAVFYPGPSGKQASVPGVGQTWAVNTIVDKKSGEVRVVYDEECVKKSRTDALSKALSWLGFGAGIHMGAFDGNKWASLPEAAPPPKKADARAKAAATPPAATQTDLPAAAKDGPPPAASAPPPAQALKDIALHVWDTHEEKVRAASGFDDNERKAKLWLLDVTKNTCDRVGVDPSAGLSMQDINTVVCEIVNHVDALALERQGGY